MYEHNPVDRTHSMYGGTGSIEPLFVNFSRLDLCTYTDPVSCKIVGVNIPIRKTWRDLFVDVIEYFLKATPEPLLRCCYKQGKPLLMDEAISGLDCKSLSNGKFLLVHYSIASLVKMIQRVCEACGVSENDITITYVPKQEERVREIITEDSVDAPVSAVPDSLIEIMNENYTTGFRFEATSINLLSSISGVDVDEHIQSALKQLMFCRSDGVCFMLEIVSDASIRKRIVEHADMCLQEYSCFETSEFYRLYKDQINCNCIRDVNDFERFYEQICKRDVRCVTFLGCRIFRYNNVSAEGSLKKVASKIVSFIGDRYGFCNEDDLHAEFCAFSTDLIGKIVKQYAPDDLVCVEINDSICYRTYDMLDLPENFSELLAEVLENLDDIKLEPSRDVLHAAISLKIRANFMVEYSLSGWDVFQRLILAFYKAKPRRKWKNQIFAEVID